MKVNRTYKIIRPMRKFGNLLKDIFNPKKSNHFWIRVMETTETKEQKQEHIFKIIELLDSRIKVNKL
mgnify:FL=1|tara:strand:+ start:138 stop:338 length:201 start_codon:yes stop_codon:yes gene_type:complete